MYMVFYHRFGDTDLPIDDIAAALLLVTIINNFLLGNIHYPPMAKPSTVKFQE